MKRLICVFAAAAALSSGTMTWGQAAAPQSEPSVKNVELTVYLLSGVQTAVTDDVPPDLGGTVKQLHSLFPYKGYKLAESFILRGRSAGAQINQGARTEGVLPGSGLHYNFGYQRVRISLEKPYMVHIDSLQISLTGNPTYGPDGKQRGSSTVASISTDLDLGDGQKTVVGKSSINSTGDALILVIVPKVIE
jgi:hypothetical protein